MAKFFWLIVIVVLLAVGFYYFDGTNSTVAEKTQALKSDVTSLVDQSKDNSGSSSSTNNS